MVISTADRQEAFFESYTLASEILCAIDTGDAEALVAMMDDQVSVTLSGSEIRGAAHVRAALVEAQSKARAMRHMINNFRVTGCEGASVSAAYIVLVAQVLNTGSTLSTCDYQDEYIRGADGALVLKARQVDLVTRFEAASLL